MAAASAGSYSPLPGGHAARHLRLGVRGDGTLILLTGAAGAVGRALLRRLVDRPEPVRCLVRDPRRLGPERVRVQIALGDLADPGVHRNAMRGVGTVVHLAATLRDQPRASVEEVNGVATLRLLRAAERAGVERFLYCSCLGASEHVPSRALRAKALAERAVRSSSLDTAVVAPSLVYTPENRWMRLIDFAAALPAIPISGRGAARFQPIWADDVAACLTALLERPEAFEAGGGRRVELAGPDTLDYDGVVRAALRGRGRSRPLVHVPLPLVRRVLAALERLPRPVVTATPDEADMMEVSMLTPGGTAGAEALGVTPLGAGDVLGPGPGR